MLKSAPDIYLAAGLTHKVLSPRPHNTTVKTAGLPRPLKDLVDTPSMRADIRAARALVDRGYPQPVSAHHALEMPDLVASRVGDWVRGQVHRYDSRRHVPGGLLPELVEDMTDVDRIQNAPVSTLLPWEIRARKHYYNTRQRFRERYPHNPAWNPDIPGSSTPPPLATAENLRRQLGPANGADLGHVDVSDLFPQIPPKTAMYNPAYNERLEREHREALLRRRPRPSLPADTPLPLGAYTWQPGDALLRASGQPPISLP